TAPDKLEWRCLQFWQIETEREFTLKPGLNRMAVGRHHVNWINAGQRRNKQVRQVKQGLVTTGEVQPNGAGNQHQQERGRCDQDWCPSPRPPWTLLRIDALCDFQAKLRPCRESATGGLSHSLQLQTVERVCGTGWTRLQVRLYFLQLAARKLAIDVQV